MTLSKDRTLKLHAVKYCIMDSELYWKDPLGFLLSCLVEFETENVINEFHKGVCGGHHAWREITYKILRDGYYWLKLFIDVNAKFKTCNPCQLFSGKQKILALPLVSPPRSNRIRSGVKIRNASHGRSCLRDLRATKRKWSIRRNCAPKSNASIRASNGDGFWKLRS